MRTTDSNARLVYAIAAANTPAMADTVTVAIETAPLTCARRALNIAAEEVADHHDKEARMVDMASKGQVPTPVHLAEYAVARNATLACLLATMESLARICASLNAVEIYGDEPHVLTHRVLGEVAAERVRQFEKFGAQPTPMADPADSPACYETIAEYAKEAFESAISDGTISHAKILAEEVAEFYEAAHMEQLQNARAELVQVAAVAVKAIEQIDAGVAGCFELIAECAEQGTDAEA